MLHSPSALLLVVFWSEAVTQPLLTATEAGNVREHMDHLESAKASFAD